MKIQRDVILSDFTSIKLGGKAKYFTLCKTFEEIVAVVLFTTDEGYPLQVLGGGTNTIFSDSGYDGFVLKVDTKGIRTIDEGDSVLVTAQAGESWDNLVKFCVDRDLGGLEFLSGIPGSVGATPIQNVGAYGYEISDSLVSLTILQRKPFEIIHLNNEDCRFGYRTSRFKEEDANKYVITEVTYRLEKNKVGEIRYKEIKDYFNDFEGPLSLKKIREAVLEIRKRKSMVIDENDINTRSVGSFYLNPSLNIGEFDAFIEHCNHINIHKEDIPFFPTGTVFRIPAAWLIETAGYPKGFRKNGVGISDKHALALINMEGTTENLLALASEIEDAVFDKFSIRLKREPTIVR